MKSFYQQLSLIICFMDAKTLLGTNLRKQRKLNHLTQEELSEKLGITTKHLGVIERGEAFCSADFLDKAASTLNVSIATLFYNEEENNGSESFLARIDSIVDEELLKATKNIKSKFRQ